MLFGFQCPICLVVAGRICRHCTSRLPQAGSFRPPTGVASASALFSYDADVQRLVLAAKNGHRRDLLRWAARELVVADQVGLFANQDLFDVVSWMPASSAGLRRRGFDQGRILAREVASELGLPWQRIVARRRGEGQIGRSREERLTGPSLRCVRKPPGRVLVIDDVVTTGASIAAFASVVKAAGANYVHVAAIAAVRR